MSEISSAEFRRWQARDGFVARTACRIAIVDTSTQVQIASSQVSWLDCAALDLATSAPPFPLIKRVAVSLAACAFVGATIWQVSGLRDDWPLSSFKMYSGLEGGVASRAILKGVSDRGEFDLEGEMVPFGGARLRALNQKLSKNHKRQRRFVEVVQKRYEAMRAANGWPVLQAIRAYNETWTIKQGLAGIDRPKRRAVGSMYIPPSALTEQLDRERSGRARVAAPRASPSGDVVIDLDASACQERCQERGDRFAAGGRALRLSAGEGDATASVQVTLAPGTWFVFARMRTPTSGGSDELQIALDSERLGNKGELGNYEGSLGRGVWVWASLNPGDPPLRFDQEAAGAHVLRFAATEGTVELDELWLSRDQRELPIWSEPIAP